MRPPTIRHHAIIFIGLFCVILLCVSWRPFNDPVDNELEQLKYRKHPIRVVLAAVSCGGRYAEALTLIKSAVLFSRGILLHVIVVVDDETFETVSDAVKRLAEEAAEAMLFFTFEMHRTWFPPENEDVWKQLYAPCSAQRIFFPSLLPHIDSLIYMDSDTFFISDVRDLWSQFGRMNESQWIAAANEDEPASDGWYNTKAKVPYYGTRGLNTGVMLLNLTRMRQHNVEAMALQVLQQYQKDLHWGDQDIFNVILHHNPEYAYLLPCEYNFRTSHCYCRYAGNCSCNSAAANGVRIVHGNLKAFLSNTYAFFRNMFKVMKETEITREAAKALQVKLRKIYDDTFPNGEGCVGSSQLFFGLTV